jgi:hypothetical protein
LLERTHFKLFVTSSPTLSFQDEHYMSYLDDFFK